MLKWLIRNRLDAFARTYGYDISYARELVNTDTRAFFQFAKINGMSNFRRDIPKDVYYAVKLVSVLAEDCGPCTQLVVTMALKDGVDPRTIATVLEGADAKLSDGIQLGLRFARAALAHDPMADTAREEIVRRWGRRALVSLAFAITTARFFPTLKYALGYGKACQRVVVADQTISFAG